ncbi:MAG: hypothetical protein LBK60_07115 [Verrucomicrobiales bacterium]|jgi:hypothetical protein|nr:hypothetical protein [Verrucomicrobiales bacterium]
MASTKYIYAKYIPRQIDQQYHWVLELKGNVATQRDVFTDINARVFTEFADRTDAFINAYNMDRDLRAYSATINHTLHEIISGVPAGVYTATATVPAAPNYLPAANKTYKAGTLPWLAKVFIPALQASTGWNDSMTDLFRLNPIGNKPSLEYHNFKPQVIKASDGRHLTIKGVKGGFKAVEIWRQLFGEKALSKVDTAFTLPWTDPDPLSEEAETRHYQLRGVKKQGIPFGAPSEIFVITARRTEIITKESV